jgi:hypothetical protein
MIRDEKLHLPANWDSVLEQLILKPPAVNQYGRTYICSPCRSDTANGLLRNIKAARIYMFYAYQHFKGIPVAPHAYLPFLLNDRIEQERQQALEIGCRVLMQSSQVLVCGNRLSEGMLGEISYAVDHMIPIQVFNRQTYKELCKMFVFPQSNFEYEDGHMHYALTWSADELAPYWEGSRE